MNRWIVMASFGAGLLGAGTALAQSMQFEEQVIVGDVLKPEVTVIISRENLNKSYDLEFEESFLHKIEQSVERAPF